MSLTQYKLKLPRAELTITGKIPAETTGEPFEEVEPQWIVVLDFTGGGEKSLCPPDLGRRGRSRPMFR